MDIARPFDKIPNGLLSPRTLKSYRSDWKLWSRYCREHNLSPLPVNVEHFTDFIDSEKDDISLSTLNRRVATAKSAHKFNNLTAIHFPVRLRIIKDKIYARRERIKQAPIMYFKDLLLLCETEIIPVRNRALVSIMFDAMLRGQDALELNWQDFFTETTEYGTRAYLKIWRTKGKWYTDGENRAISRRTALLLEEYHREASLGYKRPKSERIFPLHINTVNQIFYSVSQTVGSRYTTHSPRVGATVEMVQAGISEVDICVTAGWSSVEMVRRYARHAKAQNSGMTKFMHKMGESKWLDSEPEFVKYHKLS